MRAIRTLLERDKFGELDKFLHCLRAASQNGYRIVTELSLRTFS